MGKYLYFQIATPILLTNHKI